MSRAALAQAALGAAKFVNDDKHLAGQTVRASGQTSSNP
jgi:hypothetical protein